jgi:nitrate/nitrite transport system permease protein
MGKGAQKARRLPDAGDGRPAFGTYLSDPFYDNGPNDKGIGIQLGYSLGGWLLGFLLAAADRDAAGFPDRHVAAG